MWFIKPKEDSRCGGAPPLTSICKVGAEGSVVQDKSQLSQLQAKLYESVSKTHTVRSTRVETEFINDLATIPFGDLVNVILTALMIPSA